MAVPLLGDAGVPRTVPPHSPTKCPQCPQEPTASYPLLGLLAWPAGTRKTQKGDSGLWPVRGGSPTVGGKFGGFVPLEVVPPVMQFSVHVRNANAPRVAGVTAGTDPAQPRTP